MPKFKVHFSVQLDCVRVVEAESDDEAWDEVEKSELEQDDLELAYGFGNLDVWDVEPVKEKTDE